jgi:ligand-binding sensor domain-containing protein
MKTSVTFGRLTVVALAITFVLTSQADGGKYDGWKSYTSTAQVRYADYFDDSLQVVTSGGWLKINTDDNGRRKVTNVDGLGTNDLYYVLKDDSGAVWIAGMGRLIRYYKNVFTPYLFFDDNEDLLTLYTIADDGDRLWIGTSSGLALFSKYVDDGQIEDFYSRIAPDVANPEVHDILIDGDTIMMATSGGLAVADKKNPDRLKSFANWRLFRPSDFSSTPVDSVTSLACYRDTLFLGTTHDVFKIADSVWIDVGTRPSVNVRHMVIQGDSLMIYAGGGFFAYYDASITWNNTPSIPSYTFSCGRVLGSVHWVGNYTSGMYFGSGTNYQKYDDGGLPGNLVTALSSDLRGNLVSGLGRNGVAVFANDSWEKLDFDRVRDGVVSLVHDSRGGIWIGTWGYGVSVIRNDTVTTFGEDNSPLRGVPGAPSYIVINGLAAVGDYIFMLNFDATDGGLVRVVDAGDLTRWASFHIPTDYLYSIDCCSNAFAVGTQDNGLFYYYFGEDPFDYSDDSSVQLLESNSWLISNDVRTVRYDPEGILWVGTRFGLSRYDKGIDRFTTVNLPLGFGPEVSLLVFDNRGNVWMGSYNGLALYDAGRGAITVYTGLNSGLPDDHITALLVDPASNELWVGTSGGISRRESLIGPPARNIEQAVAFPNPYIIHDNTDVLSFNYKGSAIVRIYTVAGELIWTEDINIPWRGKNQQNEDVAPGVYLFLLTADDGSTGKGKILLIRE